MLKVLLVEDEKIVLRGLHHTVDWASVNCVVVGEAENGLEALSMLEKIECDLIITDIRMPFLDGIELIKKLKDMKKNYQFIILTAHSDFEYAYNGLKLGVTDYLLKPFDDEQLYEAIKKIQDTSKNNKNEINDNLLRFDINKKSKIKYVEMATEYIKNNYCSDISITTMANNLNLSEGHLSRLFRKEIGHSFNEYLTQYRMHVAMGLLKDINLKIYQVAEKVGYADTNYFSSLFKKIVGLNPSEYQDRCK